MKNKDLIDRLNKEKTLTVDEWSALFSSYTAKDREYAAELARDIADERFGKCIYLRGLIEISNFCRNDCLYCGIRRSRDGLCRYRMSCEEILSCCHDGYNAGFRTFVLQGGEDVLLFKREMESIIAEIRESFPDAAITLSLGELDYDTYKRFFDAGADRYLLRHETASKARYNMLHPREMSFENRMNCLENLKEIGYQVGCGMMIGAPGATSRALAEDMLFLREFEPHMIGIGPFIPAKNTPFENEPAGTLEETLFVLSLCRIMLPDVLLPSTTALGTIDERGRELGIFAGANVVMPNISPTENRKKYSLYDNKIGAEDSAAQSKAVVDEMLARIGYFAPKERGDHKNAVARA